MQEGNIVALSVCASGKRERERILYWAEMRRLVLSVPSCKRSANPMRVSDLPLHVIVYA